MSAYRCLLAAPLFLVLCSVAQAQVKLTAPDAAQNDAFGYAVAVSGDTVIAGTWSDDDGLKIDAGVAYVSVRNGSGWLQQAKLTPSDSQSFQWFGHSAALWGDTALVGAPGTKIAGQSSAGSAYVFVRSGTTWTQQAKLTPAVVAAQDQVGWSVALWRDTAVLGAIVSDGPLAVNTGSVHVFQRSGATWTEQATLFAPDGTSGDNLGSSVAVEHGTIVAGAPTDHAGALWAGSAYVFELQGGAWSFVDKILSPDPGSEESFGWSVALSDGLLAVGEPIDGPLTSFGLARGAVHVFARSPAGWTPQAKLFPVDAEQVWNFGDAVSVSGGQVAAGCIGAYTTPSGGQTGAVYVFGPREGTWQQRFKLRAPDGVPGDMLGDSVGISGGVVIGGAPGDDNGGLNTTGSAYVFTLPAAR